MSLLDVIKNLFFGDQPEKPAAEQATSTASKVEESPVIEKEAAVKAEPVKKEAVTEPVAVKAAVAEIASTLQIPEDSALKRHFISALKSEIEANMAARPTDSTLKRHHDAAVEAELAARLA